MQTSGKESLLSIITCRTGLYFEQNRQHPATGKQFSLRPLALFLYMKITPYYAQQIKVETQNFASHKHGYAIYWGDEIHFVAAFFACETQDFAYLQGRIRYLFGQ